MKRQSSQRRPTSIFLAGVVFCAALTVPGLSQGIEPALARAAQQYDQAQMTGDRPALERLVANDYILLNSRGKQEGKAELIEGFCHSGFHLQPYQVKEPFTKVLAGTVILGGLVELKGTEAGKPFTQQLRFADVWTKRQGRWVVVFTQTTPAGR